MFAVDKSYPKKVFSQVLVEPYPALLTLIGSPSYQKDDEEVFMVLFDAKQIKDAKLIHEHFNRK